MIATLLTATAATLLIAATWRPATEKSNDVAIETPRDWKLVWSDEFAGDRIDESKWQWQLGDGCNQRESICGWGNEEMQYYKKENTRVENGLLKITAKHEHVGSSEFTSSRLRTKGLASWKYARIEVRAKVPPARGTWPAIWMLPDKKTYSYRLWPDNGEIDIMEHVGYEPDVIHASVHTRKYHWKNGEQKTAKTKVEGASSDFHIYSLEWLPDEISVAVDGKIYFRLNKEDDDWEVWPFDQEFHLLLNLAVGGVWGGAKGVDFGAFPQEFIVDYVRVYAPSTHL